MIKLEMQFASMNLKEQGAAAAQSSDRDKEAEEQGKVPD